MANPISIRPWSRLASLRSSPAPESHPKPHTAEPSLKATNTFSKENNQSATKSLSPTPNVHNPMHSSQKLKLITPMTFPPSKLMVHPQPGVEATIEKPNGSNGNGNASLKNKSGEIQRQGIDPNEKQVKNKEKEVKGNGIQSKLSSSEGHGIRVITISGENRGAYMQIIKSQKKKQPIHHKGNSDGEKVRTLSSPPMRGVYGNSNVQCVNNSMVLHTSLTHHDPGMHLIIPKKPVGQGFHLKERVGGQRN